MSDQRMKYVISIRMLILTRRVQSVMLSTAPAKLLYCEVALVRTVVCVDRGVRIKDSGLMTD